MTILLDAGHGLGNRRPNLYDPGAVGSGTTEHEVVREVVTQTLIRLLARKVAAKAAPGGSLALVRIPWARKTLRATDVLISIHMNAGGGTGTEVLHAEDRPELIPRAARLSAAIAKGLGLRNRGAKPDTESFVGHVGLLHASDVAQSFMAEMGFMDDQEDVAVVIAHGAEVLVEVIYKEFGPFPAAVSGQKEAA
jgi:N-acetylmuramoyl-L-alanine amidase